MSKHTPGPWSADPAGCLTSHGLPIITKANGHLVAMLADRNEGNARLIAAAPEMLEALKSAADTIQRLVDIGRMVPNNKGLRDALAAIAKAEGR